LQEFHGKDKSIAYKVIIRKTTYYKAHNSYEDAFNNLINKNINHELNIKNLIIVYPEFLEVELTQGKLLPIYKLSLLRENYTSFCIMCISRLCHVIIRENRTS